MAVSCLTYAFSLTQRKGFLGFYSCLVVLHFGSEQDVFFPMDVLCSFLI